MSTLIVYVVLRLEKIFRTFEDNRIRSFTVRILYRGKGDHFVKSPRDSEILSRCSGKLLSYGGGRDRRRVGVTRKEGLGVGPTKESPGTWLGQGRTGHVYENRDGHWRKE